MLNMKSSLPTFLSEILLQKWRIQQGIYREFQQGFKMHLYKSSKNDLN